MLRRAGEAQGCRRGPRVGARSQRLAVADCCSPSSAWSAGSATRCDAQTLLAHFRPSSFSDDTKVSSTAVRNVGAVPDDQRRRHVDPGEGRRLVLREAEHELDGLLGHLGDGDPDGGQRRPGPPSDLEVVEADHRQLLRGWPPRGPAPPRRRRGPGRRRRRRSRSAARAGRAARGPRSRPSLWWNSPRRTYSGRSGMPGALQGGAEAGQPGRRGHHVLGPGDDGDVAVAELDQVPRRRVRAAPVRGADRRARRDRVARRGPASRRGCCASGAAASAPRAGCRRPG